MINSFHYPAWLRALPLGAAILLLPLAARAQSTGSLQGVVTDRAAQTFISGAIVKIDGTSLETTTDRGGHYDFTSVPSGNQTISVSYLGMEPATATVAITAGQRAVKDVSLAGSGTIVLEAFKVESIREGQSRAINQQRSSNTIKNIISADAIGNLPDRTVGEALGRLPGVNVVDDSKASIRGTAAQYNSVTLDGDRITTAGDSMQSTSTTDDNRSVDLSLIPAEMVGGIEVTKALTADMDADSFGGTINLVTRSAFDLKERTLNGKFEYIHNDFHNGHGYAGSITYMDVLNKERTLGVSATLSYRKEKRYTNSYEILYYDSNAIPVGNSGSGTLGSIAAVGDEGVSDFDYRLNASDIKKLGATLNLDWKVSDNTELHWRTFYEDSENDKGRFRNRARAFSRYNASSTAEFLSGNQVRFVNYREHNPEKTDLLRLGFGGKTKLASGELDYGVRYGDSGGTVNAERYIFEFPSTTERRLYSWTLNRKNPVLPVFTMTQISSGQDGLFNGLVDRKLTAIRFHKGRDHENDLSGNVDYSFNQDLGRQRIDWKVGVKARNKERTSRPNIRDFNPVAATPYSNFTIVDEPKDLFEGSMKTMGPYVSLPQVIALYNNNPAAFTPVGGDELTRTESRKYNVGEDVNAGYAMATTKFNKLEVIGGLRWEATKTSYTWLANPAGPSSGSQRYDNFYPSVLLNYRANDRVVFRAAFTNTLARPNYGDLVPFRVVGADTGGESGNGALESGDYPETNKVYLGNPNLKAQKSQNFDVSAEYYIKPSGVISVALFRKDLKDIIFRSQFKDPAVPNTIYFQTRNGSEGKVEGVEVSWQQALTFLPGPLDGLGINLNATYTKGSSVLQELVPGTNNRYQEYKADFLPEQPKKIYNAQLWWEKYGFTARVAANYVGEFVRTSGGLTSFSVNNTATRWDASVAYRLTKNFTLYVEGKNLTEEVTRWYATSPSRPEDYTFAGRTFNGGVKFRF